MIKKVLPGLILIVAIGASYSVGAMALNNPPNTPSDPSPADGAIDIGINVQLSWTGGDPDPGDNTVYDVYFGTEQDPPIVASLIEMPNYRPDNLAYDTEYYWKIIAWDSHGASSEGPLWTFTTKICDNDPPEKPEKPSGPTRARNRHTYSYSTQTMDKNGDGLFYNFSWGDSNCSGWLGPYENRQRMWAEYEWSEPGTYQVRVKAMDGPRNLSVMPMDPTGDESDWSDPLIVTVKETDPVNDVPSLPTINGQTRGKAGITYPYTFSAVDPDGDDIYYYVEFCQGCEDAKWYGPYSAGSECMIEHSWEEQGTFTIRSKTKDIYDEESEWATFEVTMPKTTIDTHFLFRFLELHSYAKLVCSQILHLF
jgi:hypothetical protein